MNGERRYSAAEVREALDQAIKDIRDVEIEDEDDEGEDRQNLLVNVALSYLAGESDCLCGAVEACYGDSRMVGNTLVWEPDRD